MANLSGEAPAQQAHALSSPDQTEALTKPRRGRPVGRRMPTFAALQDRTPEKI